MSCDASAAIEYMTKGYSSRLRIVTLLVSLGSDIPSLGIAAFGTKEAS